jgi:2-keto-4-pentenoate hydratase/2-oxohepta-3-ene-1,7-dioic acid hydratase in catechol pathway
MRFQQRGFATLTRAARFVCTEGAEHWGVVPESVARSNEDECAALCKLKMRLPLLDGAEVMKGRATHLNKTAEVHHLLPPLPSSYPPAVFAAGLNYRKHAEETGLALPRFPVVILLCPTSVCGPGDDIRVPAVAQDPLEVDYEVA